MLSTLADGLILRRGRPEDAEPLADFNARWLSDDGPDKPEEILRVWTRDVFAKPHPTFAPDLTTIVEDTKTGAIVSSIMLFPQTWTYAGIPFGVGRPELVATHPDYRRRGLVRLQMETLHGWSAEMGHRMQVITGIPWFYRQFGYEMGLDLHGGRTTYSGDMPELKDGENEPFLFRPAVLDDIPFIAEIYAAENRRYLLACEKTPDQWAYELEGRSKGNAVRTEIGIITRPDGTPAGCFVHPDHLWGKRLTLYFFGAAPGVSWLDLTPPLIRHLYTVGRGYVKGQAGKSCDSLYFHLSLDHPVFEVFPRLFPREGKPYAWYVRVPDLAGFLIHVRPVLEERLARSALAGFSGEVKVGFYNSGLRMVLTKGVFETIEAWKPPVDDEGHVTFPDLTFLSLLCGRRSFDELADFFPDSYVRKEEYGSLMRVLFPKQTSNVWGLV